MSPVPGRSSSRACVRHPHLPRDESHGFENHERCLPQSLDSVKRVRGKMGEIATWWSDLNKIEDAYKESTSLLMI